jgi:recombinational DNA repair protein RecT
MAKKTAVRRLSKMLPLSSELMEHVTRDDEQFGMRNVTPTTAAPASFALPDSEEEPPATPLADMPEADWDEQPAES